MSMNQKVLHFKHRSLSHSFGASISYLKKLVCVCVCKYVYYQIIQCNDIYKEPDIVTGI